jgi:SAM-dependent methyltransferase
MTVNADRERIPRRIRWGAFEGEMEPSHCCICGRHNERNLVYHGEIFSIYCCADCHLMYCSPRFTEASLLALYENEAITDLSIYQNWAYEKWCSLSPRSFHTERHKVEILRQYLTDGSSILDVGCSTGHFVLQARRRGFAAEGLEPSRQFCAIANTILKVPVTLGQIEQYQPGYCFDGMVLWDVLEHLYEPARVVQHAARLLKSGGILLAQVPNYLGFSNRFKSRLCRWGLKHNHFKHFGFPWHVCSFDRRSLTELLTNSGLIPFRFESWPRQMKDGQGGSLANAIIDASRRLCLFDYIMCVARKA